MAQTDLPLATTPSLKGIAVEELFIQALCPSASAEAKLQKSWQMAYHSLWAIHLPSKQQSLAMLF